ncbi:MAG: hypothetical protein WD607_00460 [Candidatus Paceibacterota bacterium]
MATNTNHLKEGCEILMQAAAPDIYRINAFRISGLNVNASTREISNQIQKNQMVEKYGGILDNHKSPFAIEPPPDIDKLRQALHRLRDPETRIIDEFFWFWPNNLDSEIKDNALDSLARNDIKTAESHWISYEATLTESNVSRHNLAVLSHLLVLDIELNGKSLKEEDIKQRDKYWKNTFKRWRLLLEHEGFWSRLTARVRQIDDPRLTTGFVKRLRGSLPYAILQINASLALKAAEVGNKLETSRQISLMKDSGFSKEVVTTVLKDTANPLRNRIKITCKSFSDKEFPDPKEELAACKKLLEQTIPILNTIQSLLPDENTIKEGACDEVALTGVSMAISYANATEDWESVIPVFEEFRKIVIGESTSNRVERNYEIFKRNIEYDRLYNYCFFCKENKADEDAVIDKPMHGEVNKDYLHNRVTWRHLTVNVPRCNECKKQHNTVDSYTWGIGVLGIIIGIICWANIYEGGAWASAIISGTGFLIGHLIGTSQCKTSLYKDYKEFPKIKELISQGWTWGSEPSTE